MVADWENQAGQTKYYFFVKLITIVIFFQPIRHHFSFLDFHSNLRDSILFRYIPKNTLR